MSKKKRGQQREPVRRGDELGDDGRCPICRTILTTVEARTHIPNCLKKHRLEVCPHCFQVVESAHMPVHIEVKHIPRKRAPVRRPELSLDAPKIRLGKVKTISWQILPQGEGRFAAMLDYFTAINSRSPSRQAFDRQRLLDVYGCGADEVYVGKDEFEGYVVFVFLGRDLAVLESPYYGNATYVIWGPWQKLSKLSKGTLLSKHGGEVKRVIHTDAWQRSLKELIG